MHPGHRRLHAQLPGALADAGGGGSATPIASGLYSWAGGAYSYFWGLWQPALSPDGRTSRSSATRRHPSRSTTAWNSCPPRVGLTRLALPQDYGLGQNDPAWSPDGRTIAFTYNHLEGALGRPRIGLYDVKTGAVRFLTGYGYGQPTYSPDGRWVAAVRSSAKGRDIVILDSHTGAELLRVTDDGHSFARFGHPPAIRSLSSTSTGSASICGSTPSAEPAARSA